MNEAPLAELTLIRYTVTNDVTILNVGSIDPAIGIEGSIDNTNVTLSNNALLAILNTGSAASLTQDNTLDQALVFRNTIDDENTGIIVATDYGIYSRIENYDVVLANAATVRNDVTSAVDGNLTQLVEVSQSTLLENIIDARNSGSIDPLVGIYSVIDNVNLQPSNAADLDNLSDDDIYGNLTQSLALDQSNTLNNAIGIVSSGDIVATVRGVHALIDNASAVGLTNSAYLDNYVDGDVFGNVIQSTELEQSNTLANNIVVVNADSIGVPSDSGIRADIQNTSVLLSQGAANYNSIQDEVEYGVSQAAAFDQANLLSNDITINNSGGVAAGDLGIYGRVYNAQSDLLNDAVIRNIGESEQDVLGEMTQSADIGQSNVLTSDVVIVNRDTLTTDLNGIFGVINNSNLEFRNRVYYAGGPGIYNYTDDNVYGGLTQSGLAAQSNALENSVGIDNRADIFAGNSGYGILGFVQNSGVTMQNLAVVINASNAPDIVAGLDQLLEVAQSNAQLSDIVILNTGRVDPSIGLYARIRNEILYLENEIRQASNYNGSAIDGEVSQSIEAAQSNALANPILIANSGSIDADGAGAVLVIDSDEVELGNSAGTHITATLMRLTAGTSFNRSMSPRAMPF